jgi:hypothetical protein
MIFTYIFSEKPSVCNSPAVRWEITTGMGPKDALAKAIDGLGGIDSRLARLDAGLQLMTVELTAPISWLSP